MSFIRGCRNKKVRLVHFLPFFFYLFLFAHTPCFVNKWQQTDTYGTILQSNIFKFGKLKRLSSFFRTLPDTPPGEAPSAAFNLTVEKVAGGWVLRWMGDLTDVRLEVRGSQLAIHFSLILRESTGFDALLM